VDIVHRDGVVEVVDAELTFDLGDAGLVRNDGSLLLVDLVVLIAQERPRDAGELVVQPCRVV